MKRIAMGVLALGAAVCAAASDGRIPIGTAPYTISAPGSYYLTADLAASGGKIITINSTAVSLDLNGHYIWQGSTAYPASCIYDSGYSNFRVFNGTLVGGYDSFDIESVSSGLLAVDHLTITGFASAGIFVFGSPPGPILQLTNNTVIMTMASATLGCIHIQWAQGGRIAFNTLVGVGTAPATYGPAIAVSPAYSLIIEGNTANNSPWGITVSGAGNKILRNACYGNYYGIDCESNSTDVSENDTSSNTVGIYFAGVTGCVYRNNLSTGNTTNYTIPGSGVSNGGGNY